MDHEAYWQHGAGDQEHHHPAEVPGQPYLEMQPPQTFTSKGSGFRKFLAGFAAPGTQAYRPAAGDREPLPDPSRVATGPEDLGTEAFVSRVLYLCKLPPDATEESIRVACEPHGEIRKLQLYPGKQCAYVEYLDIRSAEKARNSLKRALVHGKQIDAQYSRSGQSKAGARDVSNTGTLYVRPVTSERNFQDPNSAEEYRRLFEMYGEVKKVNPNRKREAEKFVEFYDLRAAEQALQNLNGYNFNGVILEVQFANQSSKTLSAAVRA
eukprot:Polyplicarium_translucidae@DN3048_c0_g2_i4.p2